MQLDSLIIAYIPSWVLGYGSVLTIEDSHFQQMAKIRAGNIPAFLDIVEYLTGSEEYLNLFDKHMIINIFKFLSQYNPKNQVWSSPEKKGIPNLGFLWNNGVPSLSNLMEFLIWIYSSK